MDKRNKLSPPSAAPDAIDPRPIAPDSAANGSCVVFCGDPTEVGAGFALALRLMGVDAQSPDGGEPPSKGERE